MSISFISILIIMIFTVNGIQSCLLTGYEY